MASFDERVTNGIGVLAAIVDSGTFAAAGDILNMELAKELLREGEVAVAQVAERVGYGSTSAFSVAFSRHVGVPPSRYLRSIAS